MKKQAFTLIELLVVIAIIAILAAILFPVFAQAREKARSAACLSNHKQVGLAMLMYSQDFDEQFVPLYLGYDNNTHWPQWPRLLQPYIKNTAIFKEPSNTSGSGYECNVSGRTQAQIDSCTSQWLEGLFSGFGRNSCVPSEGFGLARLEEPASSIAFADVTQTGTTWGAPNRGYYLVFYPKKTQTNPGCGTAQAASGNYALVARFHNEGASATYFDGHAKWSKADYLQTVPTQYQADETQWKLWYPLGKL